MDFMQTHEVISQVNEIHVDVTWPFTIQGPKLVEYIRSQDV